MKKKHMMAVLAIIIFVSCCQTVNATLIEDMGTVEYTDYLQVEIVAPNEVNLTYVHSTIDEDALEMSKLNYIPITNTTKYLFTSELYIPEYWELNLDQEVFIYQDSNSKNLYMIKINMSDIEIPDDPWNVLYLNLSDIYNETWGLLQENINNLTITKNELFDLLEDYNDTCDDLNITTAEKINITEMFENISYEAKFYKNELNNTKNTLNGAVENATVFRRFYEEMTAYTNEDFGFKMGGETEQYKTIYQYETELQSLESQTGFFPILIFFIISATVVLTLMLGYWKWAKKRSSPEEIEMLEGVDKTTTLVNRFKSRLAIKPSNPIIKESKPKFIMNNPKKEEKEIKPSVKESYDEIRKEMDDKIKNIETKVSTNREEAMKHHEEVMKHLAQITGSSRAKTGV